MCPRWLAVQTIFDSGSSVRPSEASASPALVPGARVSLRDRAVATGLSKSAVQAAVRTFVRRRLVRIGAAIGDRADSEYTVMRPSRR